MIASVLPASATNAAARAPKTPALSSGPLLLIDPDDYTSALLAASVQEMGYAEVVIVSDAVGASVQLGKRRYGAVLINFQASQRAMLAGCATVRLFDPRLPVIVITAPGPSLVEVKQWQQHTGSIDAIVEKPLRHSELEQALGTLVSTRRAEERSDRLARLMPAEAVRAADSAESPAMIEQAVLFTDLRRSTSLAVALGPSLLFERMNAALSTQAQVVRQCGGSVIKFTGDGLMATFRGSGKNHLALRCALALQPLSGAPSALPFGIGVASGLTITGFIGEAEQRHYDVIGATVHLAARLCALAGAGEVITTVQANLHAGVSQDRQKKMGPVTVRGFDTPIDCVAFTAVPPAVPG